MQIFSAIYSLFAAVIHLKIVQTFSLVFLPLRLAACAIFIFLFSIILISALVSASLTLLSFTGMSSIVASLTVSKSVKSSLPLKLMYLCITELLNYKGIILHGSPDI